MSSREVITLKLKSVKTQENGQTVYVDIYEQTRGGTKSEPIWLYKYQGRWITPFEMRVRKWGTLSMQTLLKMIYSDSVKLASLVYKDNPFLAMAPKHSALPVYFTVPVGRVAYE